jgi:hypothetical protein
VDLPEHCFCGCGEHRGKWNAANMEAVMLAYELGKWLNYLSIMTRAAPDEDWSSAENFAEDGKHMYRLYYDELHHRERMGRRERKHADKWKKHSRKTREGIARNVVGPDEPDPFEAEFPHLIQIRAWAFEDELLRMDLPDEGAALIDEDRGDQ